MDDDGIEWDKADEQANYSAARTAIAKAWVEAYGREVGLTLEFESIQSPPYYNFTTDRVYVLIDQSTLDKLKTAAEQTLKNARDHDYSSVVSTAFEEVLQNWFTSRPGFIPFYSNDPADPGWQKPFEKWDHNELSALLAAYTLIRIDEKKLLGRLYQDDSVTSAAEHVWDEQEKK